MDIQEVYALMDHFDRSALSRMKLELGEVRLTLEKGLSSACAVTAAGSSAVDSSVSQTEEKMQESGANEEVRAPLVGTFYAAAAPDEKPFVTRGQSVKKGEVVGIIEAMKLMNEIVAPRDGVIDTILVEDGAMVEYNQPLMILR